MVNLKIFLISIVEAATVHLQLQVGSTSKRVCLRKSSKAESEGMKNKGAKKN
jgi:hypothetical protein